MYVLDLIPFVRFSTKHIDVDRFYLVRFKPINKQSKSDEMALVKSIYLNVANPKKITNKEKCKENIGFIISGIDSREIIPNECIIGIAEMEDSSKIPRSQIREHFIGTVNTLQYVD